MAHYLLHKGNADDKQPFYGAIILTDNGGPIEVYGAYIPYLLESEEPYDVIPEQAEWLRREIASRGSLMGVAHNGSYTSSDEDGIVESAMASLADLDEIRAYKYVTSIPALLKERAAREADADSTPNPS